MKLRALSNLGIKTSETLLNDECYLDAQELPVSEVIECLGLVAQHQSIKDILSKCENLNFIQDGAVVDKLRGLFMTARSGKDEPKRFVFETLLELNRAQ